MQEIIDLLISMPEYVKALFTDHLIVSCIAAVVFVFVLFFSNKVANKLRTFFVLTVLVLAAFALVSRRKPLVCLCILSLIVLMIIRLIRYTIVTIRTNRRNKRIEERALEKAAKRRGSWKNRQGYSGERRAIVEPEYVPEKMDKDEIASVIEHEKADKPKTVAPEVPPVTEELKKEASVNTENQDISKAEGTKS